MCVVAPTPRPTARTISVDDSALPIGVLQLEEEGALSVQVARHVTKGVHLLLQNVGEDCHIKVHVVTPVRSQAERLQHDLSSDRLLQYHCT